MSLEPLTEVSNSADGLTLGSRSNVNKYAIVREALRRRILDRGTPGDQLPSFAQLRDEFNASLATVTRAVHDLRREGLLVAHQGKGTFIAHPQQNNAEQVITIGASIHMADWPFMDNILSGMYEAASETDVRVLTAASGAVTFGDSATLEEHRRAEQQRVRELLSRGVQGIVMSSYEIVRSDTTDRPAIIDQIRAQQIPVVFLSAVEDSSLDCVSIDDVQAGRTVTSHLLVNGYRKIAFAGLAAESDFIYAQRRVEGYRQVMAEAGLVPEYGELPLFAQTGNPVKDFNTNSQIVHQMVRDFDAVIAWFDAGAISLISLMHRLGYRAPHDLAVAGFNDSPLCREPGIELTSLRQPTKQIGREAFDILMTKINNPKLLDTPLRRMVPFELMARSSTCAK